MLAVDIQRDPTVVLIVVGLLIGALLLALLFASPWVVRVPSLPKRDQEPAADDAAAAHFSQAPASPPGVAEAQASPWSTVTSGQVPPWRPREDE